MYKILTQSKETKKKLTIFNATKMVWDKEPTRIIKVALG